MPAITNALAWGGTALGYKGLESLFFPNNPRESRALVGSAISGGTTAGFADQALAKHIANASRKGKNKTALVLGMLPIVAGGTVANMMYNFYK